MLQRDHIEDLAVQANGPRVSIYLPTHRTGREVLQDPIRFKNLLTAAEEDLVALGVRAATARDLLQPARTLLDDADFWQHQGDGLAVFVSAQGMRLYRLPLKVKELEVVADHYHVKPLLRLLGRDGRFFILAMSLNRVRLFEATRDTIRELDLQDIPESLRDAVGYDWEQRSLQFHTGAGPGGGAGGGMRPAMFHGHGSPKDDEKVEIATFLRQVDEGVRGMLAQDRAPVVLAGVDHITSMYRSVSAHPHLLDDGLSGNPDHVSAEELLARAWPLVEPRFTAEQHAAVERFAELWDTKRADTDLAAVLRAALDGRVDTLFVASGTQRWGTVDEASRNVTLHSERCPGDRDLLDRAAVQALVTGAAVYVVDPARVPGGGVAAAILRY